MISIDYETILDCCSEIEIARLAIVDALTEIKAQRNKVLNGEIWSGDASADYASKLTSYIASFDLVIESLKTYIIEITKCVEGYENLENQIMNSFSVSGGLSINV